MMFPKYPNYKASDVSWLGNIPADWNIKKFRYVFEESPEKISDQVVGDMLSVSGYRGIEVKQYQDEGRRRTDEELFGYRVVRPGQLVVNTMWLNYAGLGVSEHEGHVSPAYRSYWIDPLVDKRFIHHLMRSGTYVQGYTQLLTGIRPNSLQMGRDDLMGFPVLLPAKSEQTQIARFLDHETARIDALIEEQQRLIELLKEKRQAMISHAVTKGLDPTVPMKDSGMEWLGEVPAHWNVIRLGHNIRTRKGFAFSAADFSDEGAAVVKASDIKNHSINEPSTFIGFEFLKKTPNAILKKGNLVLSTVGSTPDVKNSAVGQIGCVPEHLDGALLNQNTVIFEPTDSRISNEYLFFALLTTAYRDHLDLNAHGTANQASLSLSDMLNFCIPLPDLDEQKAISSELSRVLENVKTLERESESLVGLLTERRSALISAAVTGKIEVRGWQPPANASTPESAQETV